jgi:opacity protein-like surface antigen
MNNIRTLAGAVMTSSALVLAGPAMAQDRWSGEITPYLWVAGIDGDATVRGNEVELDVSFDDILDETEAAFSFLGVLQRGQLVFWGQVDYLDLDADIVTPGGIEGDANSTSTIVTFAVGWQFGGWKPGQTFDVLVGARQLSLDNEISLDGVGAFDSDQDFTDGVLVVRPSLPLGERWRFNPTLSVGAGDSDTTYELWPQFQFTATENLAARIGYRRLYYDVEGDRGNTFDASFHGLVLGLGFLF